MLTAIITGVSRGLGEALAAALLARNARVTGIGRASSSRLGGDRYQFIACDLSQTFDIASTLQKPFAAIAATRPSYVCLINNAATLEPVGVLRELESIAAERSLRINLVAQILVSSLFCRQFADEAVERRIINVSSGAAQSTIPGESLYCIAKAGLEMLTKSLAAEDASPTFRAITLRPGIIDTPMQSFARSHSRAAFPAVDLFQGFHASGSLVPPATVARKVVERLVLGTVEHGRTYSYGEL